MGNIKSEKGIIQLVVVFILLISIIGGLYLVQHPQIFRPKAANTGTRIEFSGSSVSGNATSSRDVTLEIHYVLSSPSPSPTLLPDLTVVSLDPPAGNLHPRVGALLRFSGIIRNQGGISAGNFRARLCINEQDCLNSKNGLLGSTEVLVEGLAPNTSSDERVFGFEMTMPGSDSLPSGILPVTLCADSGKIIAESDESNNCRSISLSPPLPSPTPSPVPSPLPSPSPALTPSFTRQWGINWESLMVGNYNIHFKYASDTINGQPTKIPPDTIVQMKPNTTTQVVADLTKGTINTQYSGPNTSQSNSLLRVETNPSVAADITVSPSGIQGVSTVLAQGTYPTYFRVANCDSSSLNSVCQLRLIADFAKNSQNRRWSGGVIQVPWQLSEGNGAKYVFVQFSLDGQNWVETIQASISLNVPTPSASPLGKQRVFVTSTKYNGNLGGVAGADAKCQTQAKVANLGGTWKAWLSPDSAVINASSRLSHASVPYYLVNGNVIASDWNDLVDGKLDTPIAKTETGASVASDPSLYVWTNTRSDGTAKITIPSSTNVCGDDWNSAASTNFSWVGALSGKSSQWTEYTRIKCDNSARLYCFEQ